MKQIALRIKVFILLILFILPCNAIAFASEKFAPAGSKQGPDAESSSAQVFVQLAKESIIYCSGLKFTQEVQT